MQKGWEVNMHLMSDRRQAITHKDSLKLARAKNSFLVYKKSPSLKMANFVIKRSDMQMATSKYMADMEA